MANNRRNNNIIELGRSGDTECDEPCERIIRVEQRVDSLEEFVRTEFKKELRLSRNHTTKVISSVTTIAMTLIGLLSTWQSKTPSSQELRETINQTVKQVLIQENKSK